MDTILSQVHSISNHPISLLPKSMKERYIHGLCELLCHIIGSDTKTQMVLDIWSESIIGSKITLSYSCNSEWKNIKKALQLKLDGLHIISMKWAFFFDCFYLVEKLNPTLSTQVYKFLRTNICNFLNKSTLDTTWKFFNDGIISGKIPNQLVVHRQENIKFHSKRLKRILVVATMKAGKSTLINAIIGYRVNKTLTTVCTNKLCYIYNKPSKDGITAIANNGRSYIHRLNQESIDSSLFSYAGLYFNSSLSSERFCIIDTPGVNNSKDENHGKITRNAIIQNCYDAIIFVCNSTNFASNDEDNIMSFTIKNSKKPILFVLNQLDLFKKKNDSIQDMVDELYKILHEKKYKGEVIPLSSYAALLMKLDKKQLDDEDLLELQIFEKKFQNNYFSLGSYVNCNNNKSLIDKTGITLLETLLTKI